MKKKILIWTTPAAVAGGLRLLMADNFSQTQNNLPEFEKDKLSKTQAAKLAGISIPSLDKQIKLGKFKQYHIGARVYLLRSEMLESLRNNG